MPRPAPIRDALRYPATAATLLFSLIATFALWSGLDCAALLADAHVARGQLHRLLTSALLHRNAIHLAFNVYWLWTFGALIERHLGGWRTCALFATLAAASSAAEFTFLAGGVGLSGIVFGLFGFLWFFSTRDAADDDATDDDADDMRANFHAAIDRRTRNIFLTWFALCVALTLTNILLAANLAHATGLLLGVAIAWCSTRSAQTTRRFALPAAATLALLAAAVCLRPHVNFSAHRGEQEARLGYEALRVDQNDNAARWLRDATTLNSRVASWWFNRAVAESRLADHDSAMISYNHACRLEPANTNFRAARDALQDYLAALSQSDSRQASVAQQ